MSDIAIRFDGLVLAASVFVASATYVAWRP
jgi:hypothetical protein